MLCVEFMFNLINMFWCDSYEMMVDIFNNFDCQIEVCFLVVLEEDNCEVVDCIKMLMFIFDDLFKFDVVSIQMLLCYVEKDQFVIVFKGFIDMVCEFFFGNMLLWVVKLFEDDMDVFGLVCLRDVDEVQMGMVNKVKDLVVKGEIMIFKFKGDDEIIY